MFLRDSYGHILIFSSQYIGFWLSYNGSLIKMLTWGERRERQVILVVALPKAEVRQKADVRQGLPNKFGQIMVRNRLS